MNGKQEARRYLSFLPLKLQGELEDLDFETVLTSATPSVPALSESLPACLEQRRSYVCLETWLLVP
jgi:hypothetical protein